MDETSDLVLGFSTALLDGKYWHRTDDDGNPLKPLRYKFLVERYPGDPKKPKDVPHFLVYEAPKAGNAKANLLWDSTSPADQQTDVLMDPGEFRALQWVFTKRGTYVISVELQGYVRRDKPDGAGDDWKAISVDGIETSEVRNYVIQMGDPLDETEPPIFGVNLSVGENTPGGVKVGVPIPVYNADADTLEYTLTGEGSKNFALDTSTDPHVAQVVAADGASLDYETKKSYDLTLSVTDNKDHEDNDDPSVDDILLVRIDLEDQAPGMVLSVDGTVLLDVGETVNLIARYEPTPELRGQKFFYQWAEQIQTLQDGIKWHPVNPEGGPT